MTDRVKQRDPGRGRRGLAGMWVGFAAVVLLVTAAPCCAGDDEGQSAHDGDRYIALNQGVSVDGMNSDAVAPVMGPTGMVESARSDPSALAGEGDSEPPNSASFRRVKRQRRAGDAVGVSGNESTPWYQTGLGALAIVLALVGVAAWALRRWMPATRFGDSGVLRIVGRTSLSPKHNLALVQLGCRFVMVGVSGDRITTLCEVREPDEVAELAARTGTAGAHGSNGFDHALLSELSDYRDVSEGRGGQTVSAPAKRARTSESLAELLRKLRTLRIR